MGSKDPGGDGLLFLKISLVVIASAVIIFLNRDKPSVRSVTKAIVAPTANAKPIVRRAMASVERSKPIADEVIPGARPLDNWNLVGTGIPASALELFAKHTQPESVVFFDDDEMKRIYPNTPSENPNAQTVFLGTEKSIQKTAADRQARSDDYAERYSESYNEMARDFDKVSLPGNAFSVAKFRPGKRDNGETLVPVNSDFIAALQGPDYSLENIPAEDDARMRTNLMTVLSLGHGGELVLKIKGDGFLLDERGFDFAIYENAFKIPGTKIISQEFAKVGVSEELDSGSVKWFDCEPFKKILSGCAGSVPTAEGGDLFDLAELNMSRVKYIWIKDLGNNKNITSKWPTEGVDIDSVRLNHAYRTK
jgi:hypothetical protein